MVENPAKHSYLALATGWLLALGCAGGTMAGKWLNFPLSKQLKGTRYSLGAYTPDPAHLIPWSFGCVAALLILAGALAFHLRRWRALAWVGALLLWLTFFGAFKPALTDARLLQALQIEFTQQQSALQFSSKALPINGGPEPTVWTKLDVSSIEARLTAGWYFVHVGWWAALFAALLAVGYATVRSGSARYAWLAFAGTLVLLLACAFGPLRAELELMRARQLEARCDYAGASAAYRRAMRLDGWQALGIDNYAALGGIDAAQGRLHTPEYHVYHAQLASTQADLADALGELHDVNAPPNSLLADIVHKRASELYTIYARSMHLLSAYGAAAAASQEALKLQPDSLLPAYYLARDAYLVGRYQEAASLATRLLLRVDDPTVRANLFSDAGDAYTQLGLLVEAKAAYRNSYVFDYVLNLRALSALNGPGQDLQ